MLLGARTAMWSGGAKMPTARDYVQNGLIAMWDGIENAGWGVHDPNATIWKDLIGNRSADLTGFGEFTDDSFFKKIFGSRRFNYGLTCLSYEIVIRDSGSSGWVVPLSTMDGRFASFDFRNKNLFWGINISGNHGDLTPSMSASLSDNYVCINGKEVPNNYTNYWTVNQDNVFFANGVSYPSSNTISYEICNIRLYNRILTDSEIAANYAIDKARFGLT